jgi:hypothetical protein
VRCAPSRRPAASTPTASSARRPGALRTEATGGALPDRAPSLLHGATGGDDVRWVQSTLQEAGYDPGDIDGIYGYATARAVERFHRDHDLQPDGLVGPATWSALEALASAPETQRLHLVEGFAAGEQVWAGLAHEIITQVTRRLSPTQRERFWLELNLRRVDREQLRRKIYGIVLRRLVVPAATVAAGALVALVLALVGAGAWVATALVPVVTGLASGRATVVRTRRRPAAVTLPWMVDGPVALQWDQLVTEPDYRGRAGFLYFLHADMKNVLDLVATPDRPLVVFIDDLDRCSPGVVAQTIEAVNLFLAGELPNCIFVLAIEPAVVAAHIETAHKDLVDKLVSQGMVTDWSELGWRFLEKIIQLPLALPPPEPDVARDDVLSLFGAADGDQGGSTAGEQHHEDIALSELARLEHETPRPGLAAIPAERARVEQRLRQQKPERHRPGRPRTSRPGRRRSRLARRPRHLRPPRQEGPPHRARRPPRVPPPRPPDRPPRPRAPLTRTAGAGSGLRPNPTRSVYWE